MPEIPQVNSESSPSSSLSVSTSLLERLQLQDGPAWTRLVDFYYPVVRRWAQNGGLQAEDAADLAQEVFRVVAGHITRYQRKEGSFRGWLWGITRRELLSYHRRRKQNPVGAGGSEAQRQINELIEPPNEHPSAAEMAADHAELVRRALQILRSEFEQRTWTAFWRATVQGDAPADIAADLGISANAVYLAKARVLRRLREEFSELLD